MYKIKVGNDFEFVDYETACAYKGIKPVTKQVKPKLQSCKLPNSRFNFRWIPVGMVLNEESSSLQLTASYVKAFCEGGHYAK